MTPHDPTTETPFGAPASPRRRVLRWSVYIALPLAAVAVAALASNRPAASAHEGAHEGAHQHGAAATPNVARAVSLDSGAARRIGVTYAAASVGPLAREVRTVGQVTFDETRVKVIAPKVDGWVERLVVDYTGMPVRRGDPLLTIYSPMLVAAQEELLLAKKLAADVRGGTPEAAHNTEELVQAARRRLAYWDVGGLDIDRVEATGEVQRALTLRSPVGGVVIEKAVLSGQKIMAGDALYRVADLSVVWVEGEVFEQDVPAVQVGAAVEAEFEALPGETHAGRIAYVYPTLNPETRTERVRVELANPRLRLKPGMYATLRFTGGASAPVLTVPRAAVLSTGERHLVFVKLSGGRLEPREVRLGIGGGDRVEVLAGLVAGDTVVASATFLVDAESNLGSALGGMGDMPGMDMTPPKPVGGTRRPKE